MSYEGARPVRNEARVSLLKLRLSMIGVWALITSLASLILVVVLTFLGLEQIGLYGIIGFVVVFHIFQWLVGPYIINAVYRVREVREHEYPWLHEMVERLSRQSGMDKPPKLMIAQIDIPNAFAYGSPLTGNMVAVTDGLLKNLDEEEVEAVVGHELGHLKHKDVVVMMMISIIPAILYYIGYTLYLSGWMSRDARDRGNGTAVALLLGLALMALSFIFNLFVFYMSRLREYYADAHSSRVARNGARNLQRALVRIMAASGRIGRRDRERYEQFKAFFISDPEVEVRGYYKDIDRLVEEVKNQKPSILGEIFSTHPHPAKRLRFLDQFI
ncbi:MAG: zinc metalloprotease HtpX [Nitrososphaeria archaeon]|nr:zinc metalloprotease HtpX [Nitrososphaeria archaeon]